MLLTIKNLGKLFKITFKEWNQRDPFRQSAIIAYYAIFSMPGLLVLVIGITGYFFGKDAVNEHILAQISGTLGTTTADQIKDILVKAGQSKTTLFGSVIGIFILLMGATGVFVELQKSLNSIWQVKAVPGKGILLFLKVRLFSFGLILAIAFLLLISLVFSTALTVIGDYLRADVSGAIAIAFNILNFIISLAIISILFALMFKVLPDAKIKWRQVWLGAIIAGTLFTLGKTALAFYFGKAEPASVYGAAGSIVLILLWVSYSSMIMFFGAEFTAAYAKMYSGEVAPTEIAKKEVSVKEKQK
ncbi:MAG: YihY/virulence factor BrkB family protein [Bacteroidales bacterium]|jgi:membrane protein